ncbi:MAG: hypothetical protein GF320_17635 [Armatimonadia bacterium]|nr:hypothetical protein [Armatimonadia bacterium]
MASHLDSTDPEERLAALASIEALGRDGAPLAERTTMLLRGASARETEAAIDALAAMGPEALDYVWPYAVASTPYVRAAAGQVYLRMGPEGIDDLVERWSALPNRTFRGHVALSECGEQAARRMIPYLRAGSPMAERAAMALCYVRPIGAEAIDELSHCLRSGDPFVSLAAAMALLARPGPGRDRALDLLDAETIPAGPMVLAAATRMDPIPLSVVRRAETLVLHEDPRLAVPACVLLTAQGEAPDSVLAEVGERAESETTGWVHREMALLLFLGCGMPEQYEGLVWEIAGEAAGSGHSDLAGAVLATSGHPHAGYTGAAPPAVGEHQLELAEYLPNPMSVTTVISKAAQRRYAHTLLGRPDELLALGHGAPWQLYLDAVAAHPARAASIVSALFAAEQESARNVPEPYRTELARWLASPEAFDVHSALTSLQLDPLSLRGDPERAAGAHVRLASEDAAERMGAALDLIASSDEDGVPEAILPLLGHPDPDVREVAGGVLAVADTDTVPALLERLPTADAEETVAIVRALGKQRRRVSVALSTLEELTESADPEVRAAAEQALWWIAFDDGGSTSTQPHWHALWASLWNQIGDGVPLGPDDLSELLRKAAVDDSSLSPHEGHALGTLPAVPRACMNDALAYCLSGERYASSVCEALLNSPGDHTWPALALAGRMSRHPSEPAGYVSSHRAELDLVAPRGLKCDQAYVRLGSAAYLLEYGDPDQRYAAWGVLGNLANDPDEEVAARAQFLAGLHPRPVKPSTRPSLWEQLLRAVRLGTP